MNKSLFFIYRNAYVEILELQVSSIVVVVFKNAKDCIFR